jgi:sugar fermentation stimulation protein A
MTVQFLTALHKGRLLKRYKRFLADVELDSGEIITAHCPNTGSMTSCFENESVVWLSKNDDPKRKLKWTWEFCQNDQGLIGINTQKPNDIIAEAIACGGIPSLAGYETLRKEVKYGTNSRIDILLEDPKRGRCFVEVKNTTLLKDNTVMFPDAITSRGLKHLEELAKMAHDGNRSVMIFLVNRPDGQFFAPADTIDPKYGIALRKVAKAGVEILAIRAKSSIREITLGENLPIKL